MQSAAVTLRNENSNELKDYISDPGYDVTADPLAMVQWIRVQFEEEEDCGKFVRFQDDWKTGNCHPRHKSEYNRKQGVKLDLPGNTTPLQVCSETGGAVVATRDGDQFTCGTKQELNSVQQDVDTCYGEKSENVHWAVCHHGHSSAASEERLLAY